MTERCDTTGTATGTATGTGTRPGLLVVLVISCLLAGDFLVAGEPEPIPSELLYSDSFVNNAENLILLNKLKQVIEERKDMAEREKALNDVQLVIQSVLEARTKARARAHQGGEYFVEELPARNAIVGQPQHPNKRTTISYMTLCHFKICNMGRKRQLNK